MAKIRKGNKGKKYFKEEAIKRLSLRSDPTIVAVLGPLEFKVFYCQLAMVTNNTFQCSMAPPF